MISPQTDKLLSAREFHSCSLISLFFFLIDNITPRSQMMLGFQFLFCWVASRRWVHLLYGLDRGPHNPQRELISQHEASLPSSLPTHFRPYEVLRQKQRLILISSYWVIKLNCWAHSSSSLEGFNCYCDMASKLLWPSYDQRYKTATWGQLMNMEISTLTCPTSHQQPVNYNLNCHITHDVLFTLQPHHKYLFVVQHSYLGEYH